MPADFKILLRRVHCAVAFKSLSSSVLCLVSLYFYHSLSRTSEIMSKWNVQNLSGCNLMVLKRSFSMAIVTSSGRLQLKYTGLPPSFLLIFSPNDLHWEDSSSVRVAFITGIENRCQCKNKHIRNTYTLFCLCTNNNGTSCISSKLSHPKFARCYPYLQQK